MQSREDPLLSDDAIRERLNKFLGQTADAAHKALTKTPVRNPHVAIEGAPELCTCSEHLVSPKVFSALRNPRRRKVLSHFATALLLDSRTLLEAQIGTEGMEIARSFFADQTTSRSWLSQALGIDDAWVERKARSAGFVTGGKRPRHMALIEERRGAAGPLAAALKSAAENMLNEIAPQSESSESDKLSAKCALCGHKYGRHRSQGCLGGWGKLKGCSCPEFATDMNRGRQLLEGAIRKHLEQKDPEGTAGALSLYVIHVHKNLRDAELLAEAQALTRTFESARHHRPGNTGAAREAFVRPLLEQKGWSIYEWSVNAKVDFHTANGYLKNKTNPYPSTKKKLAESLGVEPTNLPN